MQHHVPFGYPTPPASPAYDNFKCGNNQQAYSATPFPTRCIPLAPEQILGRLLEGKLQLTEVLGTGAYGVVYSAIDIKTGVRYAVKCLSKYNADGTPLERRQVAYQQSDSITWHQHILTSCLCSRLWTTPIAYMSFWSTALRVICSSTSPSLANM